MLILLSNMAGWEIAKLEYQMVQKHQNKSDIVAYQANKLESSTMRRPILGFNLSSHGWESPI